VQALGGTVRAVESGYFQREIADSAYDIARRKAAGMQTVIGVNKYVEASAPADIPIHRVDPAVEARQIARLQAARGRREKARVATLLDRLEREARDASANLMPVTLDLVKARATLGEIVARLRQVFGTYVETPFF